MTLKRRTSPRRPITTTRAERERDAVVAAIAAVASEARSMTPTTPRARTDCDGYRRAIDDLAREVRERLEALDG